MEYHNLSESSRGSSRSRKAITLIVLGAFACLGAILLLNPAGSSVGQKEFIVNLAYNSENSKNQIISSARQMSICSDQLDNNSTSFRTTCTNYNTTQDVVVTRTSQDALTVYVIYTSIESEKLGDSQDPEVQSDTVEDMINDPNNSYDGFIDEMDTTFKATVSTKGVLLSLESANGNLPDTLVRLTERLIAQTFPEIDPKLYDTPYTTTTKSARFLAENTTAPVQETELGTVAARYAIQTDSNNQSVLNKQYNHNDFVTFNYDMGGEMPGIKYESNTTVSHEGVVAANTEHMHFNITNPSMNDPDNQFGELLGYVSVKIHSNMQVLNVTESDEDLFDLINQYETANAFIPIDLSNDGGFIELNSTDIYAQDNSNSTMLLGDSEEASLVFSKEVNVFRKSILKHTIAMEIVWDNYETYQELSLDVFVNNRKIIDLLSVRVNTPWLACELKNGGYGQTFNKQYTLFSVQYPIMGIITIPIRAAIGVEFGWHFNLSPSGEMCNILFDVFAKPDITAEGGLSILRIAEGGVQFTGSVANGQFNFDVYANRKEFSAELDINATLIPFEYSLDLYYRYFRCDFKKIFERNLRFGHVFRRIGHFIRRAVHVISRVARIITRIVHVCGLSNPKTITLSKGHLGRTYTFNIDKHAYLLKHKI